MKKKPNIILYTLLMIVVFFIITEIIIWGYGARFVLNLIKNYPQGDLIIKEAILASFVFIVLLLFKNSYIFTEKKEKITTGLFYGLFYLLGSALFMLIFGIIGGGFSSGLPVINILIGCFLVGITEEFLCRGWLLNEFLERFGETKKGVWYSIFISGFIFGMMHLGNIYTMGQDIPTTIMQVLSASGTGVLLGLIYYKTRNIWSVVILHALWDFSLFLGNIAPINSTIEIINSFSIISMVFTILSVEAELLNLVPHLNDINSKPKKGFVVLFSIISIILFLAFGLIAGIINKKYGETYEFDSIKINNFSVTRDNYVNYYIKFASNGYSDSYYFELFKNEKNNLVFINNNTGYSFEIDCESLYDYTIVENDEYYIIAYIDYTDRANPFLNYNYISKNYLSNSNEYMDNIKNSFKKYLLSERSELLVINDRENNKSYLAAYNADYGYYLLISSEKMAILENN